MDTAAKKEERKARGTRWAWRGAIALLLVAGVAVGAAEEGRQGAGDRATTAALQQARAKLERLQSVVPLYVAGKCRIERGSGERVECRVAFIRSKDGWAAFYAEEPVMNVPVPIGTVVSVQPNGEAEINVSDGVDNIGYRELAVVLRTREMLLRPAVYWRGGLPFGHDFVLFDFCNVIVPHLWLRASVLPEDTAKSVVWNVSEEADGVVKCELTALPSIEGSPTTRSLGWKRFRDGVCIEWARPGWSDMSKCRGGVGEYGRVDGPFDPATSFPRTMQVAFVPVRGECDELTTLTVELDRPRVSNVGRAVQAMDPATLRREGWACIEPAELYWKFGIAMRVFLGASHDRLWTDTWPFPVENERPIGTLTVRLSGAEVQKQKLGPVTGGQFWGILEVINDRDVPTTITNLLREIWLYHTVHSVLPDNWLPVRLEEGQYFRTVIHLEPHKAQGPDTFYIFVMCDDGKNEGERSYMLQASCEVVPPVAVQGVAKVGRRGKSSCGLGLGLSVHVARDVKGEPRLAIVAPDCLEPKLQLRGKLERGKSTRLDVPLCWEIPPDRQAERVWVRIIGFDDTLQPGSGWVVTVPGGSNSLTQTQASPAAVILPSP